ncbi:hypothetical protein [Brevibacillus porteri]|uniref:hypothetical protein n=1 Tax=Brevibacillus porteri TaxID=2126350 RepID=UPI003D246E67
MKKRLVLSMFILMALGMVACSNDSNVKTSQAEIEKLQAEIAQLKNTNKELEASLVKEKQKTKLTLKSTKFEISLIYRQEKCFEP